MDSANEPSTAYPPLRRARVACKACNTRRVKCDVGESQPCWHCRMRRIECEVVESRRGKYTRRKRGSTRTDYGPARAVERTTDSPVQESWPSTEIHCASLIPSGDGPRAETPGAHHAQVDEHNTRPLSGAGHPTCQNEPIHSTSCERHDKEPPAHMYIIELTYRPEGGVAKPLEVHHPIPASIADNIADQGNAVHRPLSLEEALLMPARDVADQLVRTFFRKIHPAYPVLDRGRFSQLYRGNKASPLVLQTIFLLGFTAGSDEVVHAAGFKDRATARKTCYLRAKALYDADYESDHMDLLTSMLLLGFWWSGPDDQKDTCHWVGCATTFAQALGMHRIVSESAMSQRMRSLRRRVWWSIYTRDRHTSLAFGRPCRIRDEDCDVEPLGEADFTVDLDYDETLIMSQEVYHVSYVLEMSKLTLILGDILLAEFSPRRDSLEKYETENLTKRLSQWEAQLPGVFQCRVPERQPSAWFWFSMLQVCYQNCIILLFRPKAIDNLSPGDIERDIRARAAADRITRLAEDLLATDMINSGLIHLVQALFSALSIHTIVICRMDSYQRQLAENRSRQCMLALSVIAKSWPVRIWISKSFVNLIKRLTGLDPATSGPIEGVSSSIATTGSNTDSQAQSNMPGLRIATQPMGSQLQQSVFESAPNCTCFDNQQLSGFHAYGCAWRAPDQVVHDSLWAGYLDNAWDIDLSMHNYMPLDPNM